MKSDPVYRESFTVPQTAIDLNGHVNNVVYLQWMQDVAIRHSDASGGTKAVNSVNGMWVARSHHVEYLNPAFVNDPIAVTTWIASSSRVRVLRRYKFSNTTNGKVLVKGETDWFFVDRESGRPHAIPDVVTKCFPLLPSDPES